jgi:hypothetical protein
MTHRDVVLKKIVLQYLKLLFSYSEFFCFPFKTIKTFENMLPSPTKFQNEIKNSKKKKKIKILFFFSNYKDQVILCFKPNLVST